MVLTFVLTLLFAIIVSGPVNYVARRGLGRGWATMIVIGTMVLACCLLGIVIAPVLEEQARRST